MTSTGGDHQSTELIISEKCGPKIFKLTIDCFDEIFEYLSLKDLHSFGQTCTAMQRVAGEYYKRNYLAAERSCAKDGIYTICSSADGVIDERVWTSYFNQFTPSISHQFERLDPLRYLHSHIDEFTSIKHICFANLNLNREKVQFIQKIMPQIEVVQLKNGHVIGNFNELMLKHSRNLQTIYVQNTNCQFNGKYEWLLADYPHLQHLELMPSQLHVVEELAVFFARNPKVQRFSTSGDFLWQNRNELMKSDAKLDILELKSNNFLGCGDSFWDLLKQLHSRGFYRRLFLYTDGVNQALSIKLASLPNLETICIRWFSGNHNLIGLTNLKELILLDGLSANDAEILANGLMKLERLYIDKVTIDDIQPFICHSANLNKIKMIPRDEKDSDEEDATPYYDYYDFYNDEDSDDESENEVQDNQGANGEDKVQNQDEKKNDNEIRSENQVNSGDKSEENRLIESKNNDDQNEGFKAETKAENAAGVSSTNTCVESTVSPSLDNGPNNSKVSSYSDGMGLNLIALNKQRGKLLNARKLTIYVRDDVFLTTKWATQYGDINLRFIEMKRSDSYEWNPHY